MSTTLQERPPQQVAEQHLAPRESARPTALDRLALRVGLLLITYGRRRYATPRDLAKAQRVQRDLEVAHHRRRQAQARAERELSWAHQRWLQRPNV